MIGAISHNISKLNNVLESEDVNSAIKCLRKLGVKIVKTKPKQYFVYGKGLGSHFAKNSVLDLGNSGTLARLLIGILSTTPNVQVKLQGDKSLNKRNMSKLIKLMNEFGAEFYPKNKSNLPLTIISSQMPVGIEYKAGIFCAVKKCSNIGWLKFLWNNDSDRRKRKQATYRKYFSRKQF